MSPNSRDNQISPDAMTDPAHGDGGGLDAASALAFQLVENATIDFEIGRRLRQSLAGDTDANAALKLGLSATAIRRACRSGRPSARILRQVCVVYGVDGHWLLTGQGAPTRGVPPLDHLPSDTLLETVAQRLSHMITVLEAARSAREQPPTATPGRPPSTANEKGQEWL
jgi:hypothetical protein